MSNSENLKKLKDLLRYLDKHLIDDVANKKTMEYLGNIIVEEIQKNTRLGYGVSKDGGPKQKLVPLNPKYKEARKKKKLDATTSPGKSNLTLSGRLLRSITAQFLKTGRILITFSGTHKDAKMPNAELAAIHDQGVGKMPKRPFFRLTKTGLSKVIRETERIITNEVKKRLTKILGG